MAWFRGRQQRTEMDDAAARPAGALVRSGAAWKASALQQNTRRANTSFAMAAATRSADLEGGENEANP